MTGLAYAKWGAAVVLALLFFFAGYHFGGLGPKLACLQAQQKVELAADLKRTTDTATVSEEAKTYEAATDPLQPVAAPVARLCYYRAPPAPVPDAPAAGPGTSANTPLPAAAPANSLPGPDIGGPVLQAGRDADAQVAGLEDYIVKVCLGGH